MSNITQAVFGANGRRTRTRPRYQHDYGQVLDIRLDGLPMAYEVHFANALHGVDAKTAIGGADGVTIPDEYFLTGAPIYAWLYLHTGEADGETEYVIEIPIERRARPTHEEPTPVQQSEIEQLIAALDSATDAAAESAAAAAQSAEEAASAATEAAQEAVAPVASDVTDLQELTEETIGQFDIRELPAGYKQAWYLETDGHARIDSGIGWKDYHPRIVLDVQSNGGHLFGESATSSARIFGGIGNAWWYRTAQVDASVTEGYAGQRVKIDYSDTFLKVNGVTASTFDATGVNGSDNTMTLFGSRADGSGVVAGWATAGTRLYSAKIYKTISGIETLVLDAVPCVREADDAVGLYDLVGGSFLGIETGTITATAIPNLCEVADRTTDLESAVAAIETGKQDATYSYALDWESVFGTETDTLGWQNGYYNATGVPGLSNDHRCIRTNRNCFLVVAEGVERIVFTAPEGFHARITEYTASGAFVRNVGNYSSGSNTAEIAPVAGNKYAFCFGQYADAYPEITAELVATITATVYRSVESRDAEQDARLAALEGGDQDLPDYWAAYLPARIDAVTAIQKTIGNPNDAFLLVSDYHIRTNQGHSFAMLRQIANKTGIKKIYFGGDAGGSTGTSAVARSHAFQKSVGVWNSLADCAGEYYGVLGNHEWINDNVFGSGSVFQGYLRRYVRGSDEMGAGNSYYINDPVCKIRTYFINDTYGSAPRGFNWMGQTMEAMENDWWVLVVTHNGFIPGAATEAEYDGVVIDDSASSNQGARLLNLILKGFNEHTSVTTRYGSVNYSWDFSGHTGGGAIGIFSGHYHHGTLVERDNALNTYGVPVFRASTDSMQAAKVAMPTEEGKVPWYWENGVVGGTKIAREVGTTDEQCVYAVQIDMVTNHVWITAFGGDHDWSFDFGPITEETP